MRDTNEQSRISGHIRSNVLAYVALFLALGGTAWAAGTKIGSDDIKNSAVRQSHIAAGAVGSSEIDDDAVQKKDLASGSVGGSQVAASAVGSDEIADNAVQGKDLASGSVGGSQVAASAVGSDEIADGSVGTSDMGKGAVTGANIGDQAVAQQHLSFDIATQTELNSHKSSADHDGRYFTETELQTSDGSAPNTGDNLVNWDNLTGVPGGFADGTDDTGGGGGDPAWLLDGNLGTDPATNFLGTIDNVSLNLRVNNARGLRLEPASDGINQSPNVIGGIADNTVTAGVHSATIGGGGRLDTTDPATANRVTDNYGTVGGGAKNQAGDGAGSASDGMFSTVGGGHGNTASGFLAVIAGGEDNTASGNRSSVAGGAVNTASATRATVGGGQSNTATDDDTTVAGGFANDATADRATVGGGQNNTADAFDTTVAGGINNTAGDLRATVGGGFTNTASGAGATIGGGGSNTASGAGATIAGGDTNTATQLGTTVGGGGTNHATANGATVAGGANNVASGNHATIAGGVASVASGVEATVGGGDQNTAAGDNSFVAGHRAKNTDAAHDGVFLFADSSNFAFTSTAANEFAVRATGGARVVTAIDGTTGAPTAGVKLDPGDTAWEVLSDRAAKENVVPVSPEEILERLATVPITEWNYKAQDDSIRHIGPMAQDFHRAFGLSGDDRTHLSPIDTDGVALAAIQGLDERVDVLSGSAGLASTDESASAPGLPPVAVAAIAVLAAMLASLLTAALALRWNGRIGGRLAAG